EPRGCAGVRAAPLVVGRRRPLRTSPYLLVLSAAVLWGVLGVFSKGLLDVGVSPLEIAFWRALLGGGAFVLHAALTRRLLPRSGADLASFAGFAVVGVALFFTSLNLAIDAGGISLAFILLYSAPLFVTLL